MTETGEAIPSINEVQAAVLTLLELSTFNSFDGERVARDLRENRDLWRGVLWGDFYYNPLTPLLHIHRGHYGGDTFYATVPVEKLEDFLRLANGWRVSETWWKTSDTTGGDVDAEEEEIRPFQGTMPPTLALVRLWWD